MLEKVRDVAARQERRRVRDLGLRGEVMEARPENRAWPPKAAPFGSAPTTKKEEDAKTKENIGRLGTYFDELDGLPTHIKTCSNCKEKGVHKGVGDDPGQPLLCWCVARRRSRPRRDESHGLCASPQVLQTEAVVLPRPVASSASRLVRDRAHRDAAGILGARTL